MDPPWPEKPSRLNRPLTPRHRCAVASFGAYTEVGARTILLEVTMADYSYVVNDAQITYTTIGKVLLDRGDDADQPG